MSSSFSFLRVFAPLICFFSLVASCMYGVEAEVMPEALMLEDYKSIPLRVVREGGVNVEKKVLMKEDLDRIFPPTPSEHQTRGWLAARIEAPSRFNDDWWHVGSVVIANITEDNVLSGFTSLHNFVDYLDPTPQRAYPVCNIPSGRRFVMDWFIDGQRKIIGYGECDAVCIDFNQVDRDACLFTGIVSWLVDDLEVPNLRTALSLSVPTLLGRDRDRINFFRDRTYVSLSSTFRLSKI